jgi:tetratricopeptide (TPR) repeat protein
MAEGYVGLKRFDKAIDEWSVALKLKPDDVGIEVELARAEAAAGKKEAAITRLDKLLEREPDSAPAQRLRLELE